jgi:hypothetical protein
MIFFYFQTIGYFQYNLQENSIQEVIHEIKLRTDMIKISFNNLIINLKLHKMFPSLLYKKEDYYFMSLEAEKYKYDKSYAEENEDKVDELSSDNTHSFIGIKGKRNNCKQNNRNVFQDTFHSKSTIDSEYEPLR